MKTILLVLKPLFFLVLLMGFNVAHSQGYSWEAPLKAKLEALADSLTANLTPWTVPAAVFNVTDYGAKGDGVTVNTVAIQQAINTCSAAGGGVVLFSSGDFVTGTFQIKSGVMIEVALGARILGSTNLIDYPEMIEEFKSVMSENHKFRQSLVYAEKADKIGIRGKGEIYFRGEKANFPGTQTTGEIVGRPFGIRMIQCSNVVLQDIFLHNSAAWMQSYIYCNNLIFDGIKVVNHANYNNDGLDPDGCTNLIVRNCSINSEDDAMCPKGASSRPTQNVLIENSVFYTTCNALKLGTDTQGAFRNIIARNLKLGGIPLSEATSAGRQASTGITLATVDGGNVENIYIKDVVIEQARCPVFVRIGNRLRVMPGTPKPPVGYIKNILIENVSGKRNYRQGSYIAGIPGYKVDNVIIRNYNIEMEGGGTDVMAKTPVAENEGGYPDAHQFSVNGLPAYGFYVQHATNVLFDAVSITPTATDYRPQFITGNDATNIVANGVPVNKQEIKVVTYTPKYIKNVVINNTSNSYKVDSVYVGVPLYRDRTYAFTELCDSINGAEYICLPNALKSIYNNSLISFAVNAPGRVFIGHDNRLQKPAWLTSGYAKINQQFSVPGTKMSLYERVVAKDETVVLGENQILGTETGDCTHYFVFFRPQKTSLATLTPKNISNSDFEIFPNPAKGYTTILMGNDSYGVVKVYDINGREMMSQQIFGTSCSLNCNNLMPGMYTLVFGSSNSKMHQKLIVQN